MTFYLIRHADAAMAANDVDRPLSTVGHKQVAQLVHFFRGNGALRSVTALWHSPLTRARETAALLAHGLGVNTPLIETRGLQPEDAPRIIAERLIQQSQSVALVGHEPHLSSLVTLLVSGSIAPAIVGFKKAGVLALERTAGAWDMSWYVVPSLLPPTPHRG